MKMKKDQKSKSSYKSNGHNNSSSAEGGNDSGSDNSDNSDEEADEEAKINYKNSSAANHSRCGHHGGHGSNSNFHSHSAPRNSYNFSNAPLKTLSTGSSSSPLSSSSSSSTTAISASSTSSSSSTPNSLQIVNQQSTNNNSPPPVGFAGNVTKYSTIPVESQYYQNTANPSSSADAYYNSSDSNLGMFLTS